MTSRTTRLILAAIMIAACAAACGDQEENQPSQLATVQTDARLWLNRSVTRHPLEMAMAGEIFDVQAARKARALENLSLKEQKSLRDPSLLPKLQMFFEQESLNLIDHDVEVLKKYVRVRRLEGADVPGLSIVLTGSDSSRRLILVSGVMKRPVAAGRGATAMELAAALEAMRICISRRAIGNDPPLPFDLEFIFLAGEDPGLTCLETAAAEKAELVGVVCVEEMTPARPGDSNLVLHLEPLATSTLASALSTTMKDYAGRSNAWETASVTVDLAPVPVELREQFKQKTIPLCAVRAASSSSERVLTPPAGDNLWRSQQTGADAAHQALGSAEDRLETVCDDRFRTVVAVARVLTIAVTRCRGAF